MIELIFATNNKNKINEIKILLPPAKIKILTLDDININTQIPEPFNTLQENAEAKVDFIYKRINKNIFSEDTGLFINALNGEPGVHSARYTGTDANAEDNIKKVLTNLSGITQRDAYFKTIICLQWQEQKYFFEGVCEGIITTSKKGEYNFGYDPIFIPKGEEKTFAEMSLTQKTIFSHRQKAIKKLIDFLDHIN